MGVTSGEMPSGNVSGESRGRGAFSSVVRSSRAVPVDEEVPSELSPEDLRRRVSEASRRVREHRVRLTVMLAGIAGRSYHPMPMLAAELGVTEDALAQLISVNSREIDDQLLINFLAVCNIDLAEQDAVHLQVSNFRNVEKMYRRLTSERVRRDRQERDLQQAAHEREVARAREVAKVQAALVPKIAVEDAPGHNSKPDPLKAKTEEEFVDAMRRYRVWAHNPSLREMAQACGWRVSHATFRNMLRASTVPKRFDTVEAFVIALNGTEDDMRVWASAWRHFTVPAPQTTSVQDSPDASVLHLTAHRKPSVPEPDHDYTSSVVVRDAGRG